jgi:hypothetical protein
MPGPLPAVFGGFLPVEQRLVVPVIRLAALAAVIVLCLTGAWHARPRAGPLAPWRLPWPPGTRRAPADQGGDLPTSL